MLTDKPKQFETEIDGIKYKIQLEDKQTSLNINLIVLDFIPNITYSVSYTLEDLIQKSKFFKIFDSISECISEINFLLSKQSFSLTHENSTFILKLFFSLKVIEEISLTIPETIANTNLTIPFLVNHILIQNDKIKNLQNELQELKTKINIISEIPEVISSSSKVIAEKALLSDKIILDENELNIIKNWISTEKKVKMTLLYKVSRDSDNASTFHSLCDGKCPTLTILKTTKGYRTGGFASVPWKSTNSDYFQNDEKAFLFSLDRKTIYKPSNTNYAVGTNAGWLPFFGYNPHDLVIRSGCTKNISSCYAPSTYKTKLQYELTGGEKDFLVKDLEVYLIEYE